jgi:hypothetical protein
LTQTRQDDRSVFIVVTIGTNGSRKGCDVLLLVAVPAEVRIPPSMLYDKNTMHSVHSCNLERERKTNGTTSTGSSSTTTILRSKI